jgi:co-chaperonin GroES (HSP10)
MNKFQPINKYIVITTIDEQIKTESGLLLTGSDADKFRYKKGVVVKPGTNVDCVKDGDTIYYDKGAGYTMLIEDIPYTIILERDVVVVL